MAGREDDRRRRVLRNPVRAALYRRVVEEPGVAPSALASSLDVSWALLAYHAEVLARAGLVRRVRCGRGHLLFPVLRHDAARGEALLRDRTALLVARAIVDDPGRDLGRLAQAVRVSPCVAHLHVRRLREAGLVLAPSARVHRNLAPSEALEAMVRVASARPGGP